MGRSSRFLLTGPPGVGKTTAVRRVASELLERSASLVGFYTVEVHQGGRRVGFDRVPFGGTPRIMARTGSPNAQRVGRYGVEVDAVEELARETLERVEALPPDGGVVVDEVGKMELYSTVFVDLVEAILAGPWRSVFTVTRARVPFARDLLEREDMKVVEVHEKTRDTVPDRVLAALGV